MANRVIEEMIKKAKAASIKNRGVYPVTIATNVFKQDGTPIEKMRDQEVPEADLVFDPQTTNISDVLSGVEGGTIIEIKAGEIADELVLDKGVTFQGTNAGISQNYAQKI